MGYLFRGFGNDRMRFPCDCILGAIAIDNRRIFDQVDFLKGVRLWTKDLGMMDSIEVSG